MRILVQRVTRAAVRVGDETVGAIDAGLLALVGILRDDSEADLDKMVRKLLALRIFDDESGVMNRPVTALENVGILAVSQFTLCADTAKGNRPSYIQAAPPDVAAPLFQLFVDKLRAAAPALRIETGRFRAMMAVELVNDGPVTLWLDSRPLPR